MENYTTFQLSKIKEGQIVKNYKELCNLLGIQPKGGKSKIYQLKEIERYIELENAGGNKFSIKSIYKEPLKKIDIRKEGNNTVYAELVHAGMIAILRKTKKSRFICSRGFLMENLGFVNYNYRNCRDDSLQTSKYLNTPEENLIDFYSSSHTRILKTLKSNFNIFRRKSYCIVHDVTIICLKNENGDIYRVTTDEEDELILKCENIVKKKIGIQDDAEIYYKNMWKLYTIKVKEELRKYNPDIKYYYSGYYFMINRDSIEDAYNTFVKDAGLTLGKIKDKINEESTRSAHESIVRKQDNAKKRIEERKDKLKNGNKEVLLKKHAIKRDEMITSKDYIKYNKKCVNNLISRKAKLITLIENNDEEKEVTLYPESDILLNKKETSYIN